MNYILVKQIVTLYISLKYNSKLNKYVVKIVRSQTIFSNLLCQQHFYLDRFMSLVFVYALKCIFNLY